jgi:hypothetical protein
LVQNKYFYVYTCLFSISNGEYKKYGRDNETEQVGSFLTQLTLPVGARAMEEIITAVYASVDTLKNVSDDLISVGIPQDNILVNREMKQIQVIGPSAVEAEFEEILKRHSPVEFHKH